MEPTPYSVLTEPWETCKYMCSRLAVISSVGIFGALLMSIISLGMLSSMRIPVTPSDALPVSPTPSASPPSPCPVCSHLLIKQGQAYHDTVHQHNACLALCKQSSHGGVPTNLHLQQPLAAINGFLAPIAASALPDPPFDFSSIELTILLEQKSLVAWPNSLHLPHVWLVETSG